eukprot:scaffold798_cov79-Cylindrotheca_fusiformis.AAC.3
MENSRKRKVGMNEQEPNSSRCNDDDGDSVICLSKDDKEGNDIEACLRSSPSQESTWGRPTECSICLHAYETGQSICIVATTAQCNHVVHQYIAWKKG